jgi:tetratricopeptide (TPR) repeat protein
VTAVDGTRPLDPDTLAALEEQRDFLLRSLEDLEREHDAGDVDEHDYASLRDDYTARAARSIRAIEAHHARAAARPPRSWPRTMAAIAGVVAFAVVAGVLVARFSGRREAGDALTGDIRESTRTQLDNAQLALRQERYDDAIEIYDAVLADQPDNVEAMAYKGRAQIGNGDMNGVLTLIDAAEANPDYPDTHYFLAGAFAIAGRYDSALQELDRFDALDPPPDLAAEADDLRTQVEALRDASTSTSAPSTSAPSTAAPG